MQNSIEERAMTTCPSCGRTSGGEICMHCGENLYPKRITLTRLLHSIPDVFFDIEHGLFYTARTFIKRPGKEIKRYFAGDRSRHYKPLKFILFIAGLITFLFVKFNISASEKDEFGDFGIQWNSAITLFQFPLIALATWLLFKNRKYNYGEHLVANAFIIGEVQLYHIILFPLYYIFNGTIGVDILLWCYTIFILVYYTYVFYDWFYERKTTRGVFISLGIVLVLFIVILIITYIFQSVLFYAFTKLH